jgi:hypothetical protein
VAKEEWNLQRPQKNFLQVVDRPVLLAKITFPREILALSLSIFDNLVGAPDSSFVIGAFREADLAGTLTRVHQPAASQTLSA